MPCSLSIRERTESLAIIWLTVKCLPTSRRNSSIVIGCVQSALLTRVAWYGPGSKSSKRRSCTLMHSTLWRRVSLSRRLRSSLRPPGSPTIPVAPPAPPAAPPPPPGPPPRQWERAVTGELESAHEQLPDEMADMEGICRRVE